MGKEATISESKKKSVKKLVILGSGFGGFSLLKSLKGSHYEISVVSPRNHFLFTPLLTSTTVGTIEFRSIIEPVRVARKEAQFFQAECLQINHQKQKILCQSALDGHEFTLDYDELVISVGAVTNTLGIEGVKEHTYVLKELRDARKIRQGIIRCLECAATPGLDEAQKKALLHFTIVGGGPTGVEFAAELHDFLQEDLIHWFPDLAEDVRITIFEAAGDILSAFDNKLAEYGRKALEKQNIEIKTHSQVKEVNEGELVLADDSKIACGLILWCTGIGPTPFVENLEFAKDRRGRLITDNYFRLLDMDNIYALGDCANIDGQDLPATAQVAQQQGKYLAKYLEAKAKNKTMKPFTYKNLGMLAYVGQHRALADLGQVQFSGWASYLLWKSAYITKLVGLKNKILVLVDWLKTAVFGRDISRF